MITNKTESEKMSAFIKRFFLFVIVSIISFSGSELFAEPSIISFHTESYVCAVFNSENSGREGNGEESPFIDADNSYLSYKFNFSKIFNGYDSAFLTIIIFGWIILVIIGVYNLVENRLSRRKTERLTKERDNQIKILSCISDTYHTMHLIDLKKNSAVVYKTVDHIKKIFDLHLPASETMKFVMKKVVTSDFLASALEFTDITTVPERMRGKKIITAEFIGMNIGWFRANFITIEENRYDEPEKVLFVTQSIDVEKKKEQALFLKAISDELTGCLNRRAYEDELKEVKGHRVYISMDVNGLKTVNDTLGHAAGDELIKNASSCMKICFGQYGKIFRTGGDEFMAIISADEDKIKEIKEDFEITVANWQGNLIKNMTISCGLVSTYEFPDLSPVELTKIADKRMYENKSEHYKKTGIDRRGQQNANKALIALYRKILKINLTTDSYQIISMDFEEQTAEKGFSYRISEWLSDFGKTGQVHPDTLDEYNTKTDIKYMNDYFEGKNNSLMILYKRKIGDDFKPVVMEIVRAEDFSPDNKSLYLYVKCLNQ